MMTLVVILLVLFVVGVALISVGKQLLTGLVNAIMNIKEGCK